LASVAGAPQLALRAASFSSVVASVVSRVSENGMVEMTVAPSMVSLDGGAAIATPEEATMAVRTTTIARNDASAGLTVLLPLRGCAPTSPGGVGGATIAPL